MKILYLTNIPSPYRVAFFNELGKRCDLTVIFEKNSSTERDDSWKEYSFDYFTGIILKGVSIRTDAALCPGVVRYLKKGKYDHIVVTNLSSPTGLMAIAWLKMSHIPYCIEGDGAFASKGKGLKERIKKWGISSAVTCFSTSKAHDEYYMTYGAKPAAIVRYPFTSLYAKDVLTQPLSTTQKEDAKRKLQIREKKMILSVGAYIHRKGYDLLMQAMSDLPVEWGVYLVGGEPTEEYLELKGSLGLEQIHFVPFQTGDALKSYFEAADAFVLPTREDIWGLVINEALANGLPVITTDKCIAGIELVRDNYNGFIVKHDDVQDLRDGIIRLMNAEEHWEEYGNHALEVMRGYTIEKMVEAHIEAWNV